MRGGVLAWAFPPVGVWHGPALALGSIGGQVAARDPTIVVVGRRISRLEGGGDTANRATAPRATC